MKNKIITTIFITVSFISGTSFAATSSHNKAVSKENINNLNARTILLEKQVRSLQNQVAVMKSEEKQFASNLDLDLLVEMYAHGPAVVTSPALGVRRSADDASDLMVKLSSINEDLVLLQLRQKMDDYAIKNNIAIPQRPIIALSGGVEGQVDYVHKYDKSENIDVDLSMAELDIIGEASPWATAAMIVSYEHKKPKYDKRVNNSRLKIDRGFLTIGQLNRCPVYFTIGQIFAPFGRYGSYMITDPSTKILGRFKDRMVVVGYYWKGLQAQAYGYPGETKGSKNILEHAGFNLGYEYDKNNFKVIIAGSIIGNLAESDGMQDNIFAKNYSNNERIDKRVCGLDGRIKVHYHPFTVLAEYVGAARHYRQEDISFNGHGAKPQALEVEGAVEFTIKGKPNTFALGYGRTWDALALRLPRNTLFAEYNVSLFKNTILSFEYRHDINYNWDDFAKGRGIDDIIVRNIGRHSNTATANLGVYF